MGFISADSNWVEYRKLPNCIEVDFHWVDGKKKREIPYWEAMEQVESTAYNAIEKAWQRGLDFVLMTHGSSTSWPGRTTARSTIRALMRSKRVSPFVVKNRSIQDDSCFVVALKPNPSGRPEVCCPQCGSGRVIPSQKAAGYFQCKEKGCGECFSWFACRPVESKS